MKGKIDTEALRILIEKNQQQQIFPPPVLLELIEEVERLRDEVRILNEQLFAARRKARSS